MYCGMAASQKPSFTIFSRFRDTSHGCSVGLIETWAVTTPGEFPQPGCIRKRMSYMEVSCLTKVKGTVNV